MQQHLSFKSVPVYLSWSRARLCKKAETETGLACPPIRSRPATKITNWRKQLRPGFVSVGWWRWRLRLRHRNCLRTTLTKPEKQNEMHEKLNAKKAKERRLDSARPTPDPGISIYRPFIHLPCHRSSRRSCCSEMADEIRRSFAWKVEICDLIT